MGPSKVGPLVVIVGETASGKTRAAIQTALLFNGEIISADSRSLYRGMDIGTAKPTLEERQQVPHHLIDITTPDKPLNVSDYKSIAEKTIEEVQKKGRLPILVGGSGLYVDSVIFDFDFNAPPNESLRAELNNLSVEDLQKRIQEKELTMPLNAQNRRHLVRKLETGEYRSENNEPRTNTLIIGLQVNPESRLKNIEDRIDDMFQAGLEKEVADLVEQYGWDLEPMRTIGYQEFRSYFLGEQPIQIVKQEIINGTNQYAKRQRTWFRRNKAIQWVDQQREIVDLVTTFLNK